MENTSNTETTGAGINSQLQDFITRQQQPREQIEPPPYSLDDEEVVEDAVLEDAATDTETGDDYQNEAMMAILLIDSGVGIVGTLISGLPADRYQKFTEKRPPKHYLNATAKLIEKYSLQGALSPEMVFLIALVSVYSGSISKAMADRATVVKKAKAEAEQQEKERMRAEVLAAKEARQ